MRNLYRWVLEKEIKRIGLHEGSVCIVPLGKDVYLVGDGNRFIEAKGHKILRILKKVPNKAGYDFLWQSLKPLRKPKKVADKTR
jgi:hypothetical protein